MSTDPLSKDHEYIRVDGDIGVVGITDYAQEQLGDVVFVDLPASARLSRRRGNGGGRERQGCQRGLCAGGGTIVEVNAKLADNPGTVNEAPMGNGWFLKLKIADKAQLDS
jgi:glycine cleavage system H protein